MDSEHKIQAIKAFIGKLGEIDIDGAGEYLSDDAVLDFPFLESLKVIEGRAAIVERIKSTTGKSMKKMEFSFDEWYETRDPDVIVVEYRVQGIQLEPGKGYSNRYITVFRFVGDKIALYKNYFNPLKIDPKYL